MKEAMRRLNGLTHTPEFDPLHPTTTTTTLKRPTAITVATNKRSPKDEVAATAANPMRYRWVRVMRGRFETLNPKSSGGSVPLTWQRRRRGMRGVKVRTNYVYPSLPPHSVTNNLIPPFHYKKSSQSSMRDTPNQSFAPFPSPHVGEFSGSSLNMLLLPQTMSLYHQIPYINHSSS
ncbi:hypothetical protein TEA_026089 [Camellia sinensis var. sinensis]|uniref:Uncharacterized protein n=2 Tax=Camellia sinensis TaxID=4442 RepID=A0A4S4DKE9_CAMSN|nr:hypothetical protein TEA_026089 [Camellia sinensis var. sinensis]